MNMLTKRVVMTRKTYTHPRYFMHMLFGAHSSQLTNTKIQKSGLIKFNQTKFSTSTVTPASSYSWEEDEEEEMDPQISKFTHKSNAQELITQVPVIEVDTDVVRCYGISHFGHGHSVQYIALNT
mmetsp:Transcript_16765/g.18646  ORF Transcript_16765/g.18646 Transcript_16765/m.18646 type:complete len:124 (+) Transcript_16765:17-388(+)